MVSISYCLVLGFPGYLFTYPEERRADLDRILSPSPASGLAGVDRTHRWGKLFHQAASRFGGMTAFAPVSMTGSLNLHDGSLILERESHTWFVTPGMCCIKSGLHVALPKSNANSRAITARADEPAFNVANSVRAPVLSLRTCSTAC